MWPTIITLCLALSNLSSRKGARRRRPAFRRPLLERLEGRTLPTTVTILGSDLHTAAGLPEQVRVAETGTGESNGTSFTVDAAPGVYHLTNGDGTGTYGSFAVASDGTISGTTGALVASGSMIDFDVTKLAAVTIYGTDLKTAAGLQQQVDVSNYVHLPPSASTDTVYVPATTVSVTDNLGDGVYGTFTVSDNGSGSLAVTGTSGAAVATGNIIHFDETKLAAVTVVGTDLKTANGLQQHVNVQFYTGLDSGPTDTLYVPAATVRVTDGLGGGVYGTFTVADNGSGALVVTGTTGAAVATGNTIHFDLTKLAAVTVVGTDLKTAAGVQEAVNVQFYVGFPQNPTDSTDTVYVPATTVRVTDANGDVYGTFTVSDNGSGSLAVTGTSGAAVAAGNAIHFDLTKLAAVTIFGTDLQQGVSVQSVVALPNSNPPDTVYVPAATFDLRDSPSDLGTFTVSANGSGALAISATTGVVIATDPHTIHFSPPYFLVTNTCDSGPGSLRQAILGVNSYAGPNATIDFNIPSTDPGYNSTTGAFNIKPLSALPTVTDAVVIDGYSQPGASPNTLAVGDNAVLKIVLDGSLAGAVDGLAIAGGNSTVRGLVIDNFAQGGGLVLNGGSSDVVTGNFIGTDVTGESAAANNDGIDSNSSGNVIGGTLPADRNIISGNSSRLPAAAHGESAPSDMGINDNIGNGNLIQGNYIGTDKSGTAAVPNGNLGVFCNSNDTIGGIAPGAGNVISGNAFDDVDVSHGSVVQGNFIGTDATGTFAVGDTQGSGVNAFRNATIGGTAAGAGNLIAGIEGNQGNGILIEDFGNVILGNTVGLNIHGAPIPGFDGISLDLGSTDNVVGGTAPGAGNVTSNNRQSGIFIQFGSAGNDIQGNTTTDNQFGILIRGTQNTIGGSSPGAGNVIDDNDEGIFLQPIEGNEPNDNLMEGNTVAFNRDIGVNVDSGTGNSILGNSIFANGALGIDLGGDGFTPNDSLGHVGPNNYQNFPILSAVSTGTSTRVVGTLNSAANTTFTLDFYADSAAEPSGFRQGKRYLGCTTVTTNSSGNASFDVTLTAATGADEVVTATATDPGGNTSEFFQVAASLSGIVFEDFNNDGQVDFGERGIAGVTITLTGTDDLGHAVNLSQPTDADGAYIFGSLRPGSYYITETQPAGYVQGIDSVGTAGGSVSATDQFFVALGAGVNGLNYNFGEQPPAGGGVHHGQTATIGFWNNKNGQALIKALNGGSGTQLADWLAATLPHTFGKNAANDVAGQSNAYIAALFQSDFVLKGVKLDAQLLATALSVYATNATLDPTKVAASYGFTVSGDGAGTATVNVGSNGDAFGVANNTTLTLMDLLLAADAQAVNGVLYGGNTTRRNEANAVFSAVNQAGDIS